MKYASKADLLARLVRERERLLAMLDDIPPARRTEPGVWGDDWTTGDLFAHLHEWHRLFLGWFADGRAGQTPRLPAPGYKWNETPRLNRDLQARHRGRPPEEVLRDFAASAKETGTSTSRSSSCRLGEDQLFEPGYFAWTGSNALVTYAGANTVSHYRFAQKVLRRWLRRETRGVEGG